MWPLQRTLATAALAAAWLILSAFAPRPVVRRAGGGAYRAAFLAVDVSRARDARVRFTSFAGEPGPGAGESLSDAFGGRLEHTTVRITADGASIEGWLPPPRDVREPLALQVDPAPLARLAKEFGARYVNLTVTVPEGTPLRLEGRFGARELRRSRTGAWSMLEVDDPGSAPARLEVGFARSRLAGAAAFALAALALPWLLAAWVRRRARAAAEHHPAGAWFRGMQWLRWSGITCAVAVVAIAVRSPLRELLDEGLYPPLGEWSALVTVAAALALEAWAIVPLALAEHDLTSRFRGTDFSRRELLAMTLLQLVPLAVLVLAIAAAIVCLRDSHPLGGIAATLAGLVLVAPLRRLAERRRGFEPQALTRGELRDRVAELAARAGVRLRGVYVLPLRRSRMANAFAVSSGSVLLTDWLVEHVERSELDAIVAHELGHLRHGHPRGLALAGALGAAVGAAAGSNLPGGWGLPLGVLCAMATTLLLSRRFERTADAEAVELCGDPEALIRALVRITHLNHIPVQWSRTTERTMTHPSTERRARAIGAAAGLSPGRVTELLGEPAPVTDPYRLPPVLLEGGKVFSTSWKAGSSGALTWTMLAAACVAPACALALARLLGAPRSPATFAAILVATAAVLAVFDVLAVRGTRDLRTRLARRLRPAGSDRYVAISPGPELRSYDGYLDWDLGFLAVDDDALCYRGEECSFRLPRSAIRHVGIDPGPPGWLRAPRVAIEWSDDASGRGGVVWLRPADIGTVSGLGRATPALARALENRPGPAIAPSNETALPPRLEDVSGAPLREGFRVATLVLPLFLLAPLAALAAAVLVLPLSPFAGAGWLETWLAAAVALVLMRVPAWASRRLRPAREPAPLRRAA